MGSYDIPLTEPTTTIRRVLPRGAASRDFRPGPPVVVRGRTSPPPILADLSFQPGTLTVQSGGFDPSQVDYRPPTFTPNAPTSRYPTPLVSGSLPTLSSTPTFSWDSSRIIPTPSYPTPLVSVAPRYPVPRRSFWDFFRPAPRRLPYPRRPLVPSGELYAAGIFGPGIDAVPEMPEADAATAPVAPTSAATSPWLLIGGLAVAGFLAYRYLGKRRAAPGVA